VKMLDVVPSHATRTITLAAGFIIGLSALVIAADQRATPQPVSSETPSSIERSAQLRVSRAELPLSFEPNLGQAERHVKFLSRGSGYELLLTEDKAVLLLNEVSSATRGQKSGATQPYDLSLRSPILTRNLSSMREQEQPRKHAVLAMRLVGANRTPAVTGLGQLPGKSNYFIGSDPRNWHTNVPNYAKVQYEQIYPGIDLVYYGNQSHLEYDFAVAPGVDPSRITLAFEAQGQAKTRLHRPRLDDNGDLVVNLDGQEVRFRKPFVYQPASEPGVQTPVEGRYVLRAHNQIGFELGQYDRSKLLVIDPILAYSTYLGGNSWEEGFGVALDASGNIIVAGSTSSTNFPTANAFQSQNAGSQDVFVTKFNPSGTSLMYSTYLGGASYDACEGLALDSSGNAYITGYTNSKNFPTQNPIQGKNNGIENVFLSELSPTGSLLFSTYYGGSQRDDAFGLALDSTGLYVVGITSSFNYPTVNPFQSQKAGFHDAFLTKFSAGGGSVIYSTYLGGAGGGSNAYAVAVDSSNSPYLTGQTTSNTFPLMNPFQSQNKSAGAGTVFVTKFAPAGNTLVYSTYLGGSGIESAGGIAVDSSGDAYVAGGTASVDFPTMNAFQAIQSGHYDAFVTKFSSSGSTLVYSTFIGGTDNDFGSGIVLDSSGNAYVAGYTLSTNFPTTSNAFQLTNGGIFDAFVLGLNSAGSGLIYSSYLGGAGIDASSGMTIDSSGNVYVTGSEASTNFPVTSNAFQSTYGGGTYDAFLAIVSAVTTFPLTVSVTGTGTGTVTSNPLGINCGAVCSATFASGTVTLTANAGTGSIFTGWSGACVGTGVCNVTLNAAQAVTATFAPVAPPTVLYNLGSNSGDPVSPTWPGIIAQGRDGNLYSTAPNALSSNGAAFSFTPSGTVSLLATNFGANGAPRSGLTLGTDGNFYGTTFGCSSGTDGSIFNVTAAGGSPTIMYTFTGGTDGECPTAPPIQGNDGNFYGTASRSTTSGLYGSVYKLTPPLNGLTPLHDFVNTDGANPDAPLVQASNGNFYGVTQSGGSNGAGNIYQITPSGGFSVLFTFNSSDGNNSVAPLIQGSDGNFYGTSANGGQGTNNMGVVFKVTPTGTFTALHYFTGTGDGAFPFGGLVQASDGNFYGTTAQAAPRSGCGTIFRISNGNFATVYTFPSDGSAGCNPEATLVQHTSGVLYGDTNTGGSSTGGGLCASGCGVVFSLNADLPSFVKLVPAVGNVGSSVGILGQGFDSTSVVKFNGVQATNVTLTGTTFLSAMVPAGASTGLVTVTTGTTTLSSTVPYVVHNSWSSPTAMPVGVAAPATGFINGNIYIVGGFESNGAAPVSNNQVYNPTTNTWTTAAPIPTPVFAPATAVVSPNLYVIGGFAGSSGTPTNIVQVYNANTNTWSTKSAMPTARGSATAVVSGNAIYVIGGNGSTPQLNTVEKFVPSTNTWSEEATLLTGKSDPSGGLLGTTIVAADGFTASGDTGDNESYNVSTNVWSSLKADPSPRNASCSAVLSGQLYVAAGLNNKAPQAVTTVNESFSASANKWASLAAVPTPAFWQGSAAANGMLYCFGGQAAPQGVVINNVQIYQP
jgi:uncharacterized repeat protein (TIGR03803 family)